MDQPGPVDRTARCERQIAIRCQPKPTRIQTRIEVAGVQLEQVGKAWRVLRGGGNDLDIRGWPRWHGAGERMVDLVGIEPTTSSMPWKRAPSCATGPREETFLYDSRPPPPVSQTNPGRIGFEESRQNGYSESGDLRMRATK